MNDVVTLLWGGTAAAAGFILLGNLFATFPDLRLGVFRLLILLAVGFAVFVCISFAQARAVNPKAKFDWKPIIGLGAVVGLLLLMGV